ncbi:hypothetical protein C8J56DRAFT_893104 [Mycena floridula]|nr:hypothetical protein C8J56DRAFT_893104 [Mycena floridula]
MTGGGETEREESPDGEGDREVSPAVTCFQYYLSAREFSHSPPGDHQFWIKDWSGLGGMEDDIGTSVLTASRSETSKTFRRQQEEMSERPTKNSVVKTRLTEKGLPSESGPVSKARRLDWRPLCKEKGIPGLMVTETSLASNLNDCMWRMGMESGDERESQSLQMEDVAVPDRVLKALGPVFLPSRLQSSSSRSLAQGGRYHNIKISTTCEHPFQQQLFPEGVHETLLDRPPITKQLHVFPTACVPSPSRGIDWHRA